MVRKRRPSSACELLRFVSENESCSYLPEQSSSLEYRLMLGLSAREFEPLLTRGWRRFGISFFRPVCKACQRCVGLRVPLATFQPTRSQRRALQKNRDVRVAVGPPKVDQERLDLYHAYHADMAERRGWSERDISEAEYIESFVLGAGDFGREFRYHRDGRLIGIGYVDWLSKSGSSVYFFHSPEWRSQAPGVFSLLCELELLGQAGLDYHYLGYWIAECPSMAYKNQYRPHELLERVVDLDEEPRWRPAELEV